MRHYLLFIAMFFLGANDFVAQQLSLSYFTKAESLGEAMSKDQLAMFKSRLDEIVITHANGATELTRLALIGSARFEPTQVIEGLMPSYTVSGSFLFVVSDVVEKQKFTQATIRFSARGDSEAQAKSKAISSLNGNAPELKELFAKAAKEISDYYNARCASILVEADGKVASHQHDEAIYLLTSLPFISDECNRKLFTKAGDIYMAKQNYECSEKLNKAKSKWAAAQDLATAKVVGDILGSISHEAVCFKDVEAFAAVVTADVKRLHDQDFKVAYEAMIVTEQQRIEAARQVGIAYGKNQVSPIFTSPK